MFNIGTLIASLRMVDEFTPVLKRAQAKMAQVSASIKRSGEKLKGVGRSLSTGLTLPLVAMGAAAGVAFGSFESNMNKVRALSGAAGEDFTKLSDLAKELGKSTKFSASEAADAMGFLAMAGFKTTEIMGALPGVLELAASANLGLAESADITTNILTGYGRTVEQVGETNDILVKAFTSANTDLVQLGQAFKFVGPVAKGAGVAFEEATAMLALMGNAGIQASMAGTGLRGAIVRLLNPTKKVNNALLENGIITKDAQGNLLPLSDIVQQLGERSVSAGDMMTIFGMRAGPAMVGLVGQGHEAIRKLTSELENAGGIASRVAKIQMEGLKGSFIRFKSAAEGAMISVGEQLAPALKGLLEAGIRVTNWISNKFIPAFTSLSPLTQQIIIGLIAFAAALGPLLMIVGQVAIGLGALSAAIAGVSATMGLAFVGVIVAVAAGFALWKLVQWARETQIFGRALDYVKNALGFLSDEEYAAAQASRKLNENLGDVTPTAEELRDALGEAGISGSVKELHTAMANLGGVVGGLNQDEMYLITQRALQLRDAGEELTPELQRLVDVFDQEEVAAKKVAEELEQQRQVSAELAVSVKDLRSELSGEGLLKELELLEAAWAGLTPEQQANADTMRRAGEMALNLSEEGVILEGTLKDLAEAAKETEGATKAVAFEFSKAEQAAESLANEIGGKNLRDRVTAIDIAMYNLAQNSELTDKAMLGLGKQYANAESKGAILNTTQREMAQAFLDAEEAAKQFVGPMEGLSQATESLVNKWGDAGLSGEVAAVELAFKQLSPEMLKNSNTMKRVAQDAAALRDRGGQLSSALDSVADSAEDMNDELSKSPGFLASIKASGKSLLDGITGGKGMSGFFSNLGTGIVDGLGSILSGGITSLIGVGVGLAVKGISKIGSAIGGWLFGDKTVKNIQKTAANMWDIALTKEAAKAAKEATEQTGDAFTGMLMSLGAIIEQSGGVMAVGFSKVAAAARDTFSAIDMGKMDADTALQSLLPVLGQMAAEFENADAVGQAAFLELIQLAQQFGLDMEAIVQVVGQDLVDQALGNDLPGVLTSIKDGLGEVTAEGLEPMLDQLLNLGVITEEQKQNFMEMAGQAVFDTRAAEAAAERWGIALEDLGPKFHAAKLGERAQQIADDFAILAASGMPVEDIILAQGDAIHALVRDSRWAGTAIPESMRPVIAAMIEQGTLTDENGEKITDIGEIEFAQPMEARLAGVMESLAQLIQDFIDALKPIDDVKEGVENIPDADVQIGFTVEPIPSINIPDVRVGVGFEVGDMPQGMESFQHGTGGKFIDFGAGTPAILHGKERVQTLSEAKSESADLQVLEKRLVSIERLLRDQPRALSLAMQDSITLLN